MATYNFPPTSRYYSVATATFLNAARRPIIHLRRRLLPPADRFALLQVHVVTGGERPDTVASTYLGDAEAFWRIADANGVMRPQELTERLGRHVRITLPEGIPGPANA